jgi:hypothetical protein
MWRSGLDAASRTAATILLLVNQPYLLELHMGQFTFVAIVLTLVAMRLLATVSRAGGMLGAGVLLAMATVLKTFPLVTVPAMVRERRARLAALGAAVALAAILIASAGGPAGPFSLGGEDLVGVPHPGAYSLVQAAFVLVLAILHVWLPTALPLLPAAIVLGAAAATAVVVWRRSPEVVPGAAVMLIVFFLGFFHTWEHHYSGAIVAGTALLLPARGAVAQSQRPALLVCLALLALPTPYALLPTPWTAAQWIALSLSKALPLCGAFVVGLRSIQQTANSSVSL